MSGVYRLTPYERETIVNYGNPETGQTVIKYSDDNKTVSVFTWDKKLQARLVAHPEAKLIRQGQHKDPGDRYSQFEVPVSWIVIRPPKKMKLTAEQRHALAERLRAGRANV